MSYYPTLTEDVARAKEMLAKGANELHFMLDELPPALQAEMRERGGGTIYGADTYAAYMLLRSFVEVIEAVGPKVCELALRHDKRARVAQCGVHPYTPDAEGICTGCGGREHWGHGK